MSQITTDIEQAVADLTKGKPVAIPTETVYGLAAPINNANAIKAVFAMKNRPLNHPLIVHVAEHWDLTQWVEEIPEYAHHLISLFWPGPLTLVLKAKEGQINPLITGGQTTVAIRCPAHPVAQQLLQQIGIPLVAPSANPYGKISPTTAVHVMQSFMEEDLTILDGGRCTVGIESTIVDATHPDSYQILRHGLLDEKTLAAAMTAQHIKNQSTVRVPGAMETHYQPEKNLYYFDHYEQLSAFCKKRAGDVYVIARQQPQSVEEGYFHAFSDHPDTAAFDLYYQLRKGDASNAICIAIELPPDTSEWQGIRERILKAGYPYSKQHNGQ